MEAFTLAQPFPHVHLSQHSFLVRDDSASGDRQYNPRERVAELHKTFLGRNITLPCFKSASSQGFRKWKFEVVASDLKKAPIKKNHKLSYFASRVPYTQNASEPKHTKPIAVTKKGPSVLVKFGLPDLDTLSMYGKTSVVSFSIRKQSSGARKFLESPQICEDVAATPEIQEPDLTSEFVPIEIQDVILEREAVVEEVAEAPVGDAINSSPADTSLEVPSESISDDSNEQVRDISPEEVAKFTKKLNKMTEKLGFLTMDDSPLDKFIGELVGGPGPDPNEPLSCPIDPTIGPEWGKAIEEAEAKVPEEIKALLKNKNWLVRNRAVMLLVKLDPDICLPYALKLLHDSDLNIRLTVATMLGYIPRPDVCVPALINLLLDSTQDYGIRANAAGALGYQEDVRAMEPLIYAFHEDPEWSVRMSAVTSLGSLRYNNLENPDPAKKKVFNVIVEALESQEDLVVQSAVGAFGSLGDPAALPLLLPRFIRTDDLMARLQLVWALEKFAPTTETLFALEVLSSDDVTAVKDAATLALQKLRATAEDPDTQQRNTSRHPENDE